MTEYYTTITKKQVNVLYYAQGRQIRLPKSMLDYLYAMARQGDCLARDPAEEDFRRIISNSVGELLKKIGTGTYEEYQQIEKNILGAFRQLCAIRKGKMISQIKTDLDNMTAS